MDNKSFSPRDFLKARRPEQFSDSVVDETPILDSAFLEYHLETLTSRGQDKEFEHFAKRLAERVICPNLLPQTGPTGGGDSQVDSETFPVADALALGWHVGIGREAASERWAFAFSAKKDWRPKLRSDIEKIAESQRGYTKAFFVTNQFVRDRARAQVEDELRKKHKLDVRVLDRTWILDQVFGNRLEGMAIEALGIAVSKRLEVRKGPRDVEREQELEEAEERIAAALQEGRLGLRLVEDCLDAATLARGLERPRTEVEGRLARAESVAERVGTDHQRLRNAYLWAWTAYFWYEDYPLLLKWYRVAEERAKNSRNSHDLELLHNLWSVLYTAVHAGKLTSEEAALRQRTHTLSAALKRLSKEEGRPSTTLHARTLQLQLRLISAPAGGAEPVLRELRKVVLESEGLVGYPLEPLVEVLTEIGHAFDGQVAYEDLFETIVEVTSKREGDLKAARMLLKRGAQQLDASRPYEAIRTLGRALRRLHTHESRDELVRALYFCGAAYERAGLLWAARGTLLHAASVATNDFWAYSELNSLQAACYRRLKWVELRIGRIPHALAWHEMDRVVRTILGSRESAPDELLSLDHRFAIILGILILKADIWQLKVMVALPDVLEKLGLHFSALALLYALGHEDQLPPEFVAQAPEGGTVRDFFMRWRGQPASDEIAASPQLGEGRTVALTSRVLGCRINLESENAPHCVALSESLLAAVEALFSTGVNERVIAREPVLTLNVRQAQFAENPFGFEVEDRAGMPHVEIRCVSFNPHQLSGEVQGAIRQRLFELLIEIFARVFFVRDPEQVLSRMFGEELAPERALDFTTSLVTLGNVLGHEPRTTLAAWTHRQDGMREYPLRRTEEWDARERITDTRNQRRRSGPNEETQDLASDAWDPEGIRHTDMETVSLIRGSLWDKAELFGAVYLTDPEGSDPPLLGLVFRNASPAEQIFSQWKEELGSRDTEERLRISIIRGVDSINPFAYRIVIGSSPVTSVSESTWVFMMSRMRRMDAESDENLNRFLRAYEAAGEYVLVPVSWAEGDAYPSPLAGHLIKRELHVREAWQVGLNDPDAAGIDPDEEPIIPEGQQGVPVSELIRWLRAQKA